MNPTDAPPPPEALPTATVVPPRQRLSLIWFVPLVAILVGLGLAVQALRARGPEIALQFTQAEGLEAGKTRVKFKDVDIGTVKLITLNPDRKSVRVTVQMDKQAEPLLVEDSRFWVVRPRVAAGNVSGLGTLMSGAYIAVDPGHSTDSQREFIGLDQPPLVTSDTPGRQFVLAASDLGSLDIGAPVYFRRMQVGRVVGYSMREDGQGVEVRIFIDAPYHRFVTPSSRFWHASGIDLSLDANGVRLTTQSLVSIALGGVAFSSPEIEFGGEPLEANVAFMLYPDQATAQRMPDTEVRQFVLVFHESVRGLTVGAPVDFRGLTVGEVMNIDMDVGEAHSEFAIRVLINLYPERFADGFKGKTGSPMGERAARETVDRMVAKGFRAQLRTGNLVSGQRYVALDFFPNAKPARMDWKPGFPELPVQAGTLDSLQEQVFAIADTLRQTLKHVDQLVVRLDKEVAPELSATLRDAHKTLEHTDRMLQSADRALLSADRALVSDGPLQLELRDTLREVSRAAQSVRSLADLLERQPEALLSGKKEDPR